MPLLWAAYTAYEWESTNVEMEDGILSDPTLENVLLPGAGSAARKTVRGGQQVASKLEPRLVNLGEKELATSSRILRNELGAVGESVGERAAQGVGGSAKAQGFSTVKFPRGPGAGRGPVPEGYTRVSRWMSAEEAAVWVENGATRIPPGVGTEVGPGNIRLYVTRHGVPRPGGTGPVRVDFEVPERVLQQGSRQGSEWPQIIQSIPNVPIYNVQINYP